RARPGGAGVDARSVRRALEDLTGEDRAGEVRTRVDAADAVGGAGVRRALHVVDVVVARAPPEHPGVPEGEDLLAAAAVEVHGGGLAGVVVGARPDLTEQAVDLFVDDPAEVQGDALGVRRVPPDELLVGVDARVVAPAEGLEVAGQGLVDELALRDLVDG